MHYPELIVGNLFAKKLTLMGPDDRSGLGREIRLPVSQGFDNDFTAAKITAAAEPDMALAGTIGTDFYLISEAVQNGSAYGQINFEAVLPDSYQDGSDLTLVVDVERVVAAGTTLTSKVDASVHLMSDDGDFGSDLVSTAEITFTTAGEQEFSVNGASLSAGDRIIIRVKTTATEGGNTGTLACRLNSVRLK